MWGTWIQAGRIFFKEWKVSGKDCSRERWLDVCTETLQQDTLLQEVLGGLSHCI